MGLHANIADKLGALAAPGRGRIIVGTAVAALLAGARGPARGAALRQGAALHHELLVDHGVGAALYAALGAQHGQAFGCGWNRKYWIISYLLEEREADKGL